MGWLDKARFINQVIIMGLIFARWTGKEKLCLKTKNYHVAITWKRNLVEIGIFPVDISGIEMVKQRDHTNLLLPILKVVIPDFEKF